VASNAAATSATLDEWNEDPDSFWVRRAAMLCLLDPLRTGGDWCRFVRYATSNLDDGEFFIRKAIGWVLREVSKRRPELVAEFVDQHGSQMSGVTMREATKYLPRSVSGPSGT
jgi:3-methyladenine DNA glycosylase AlkD